MPFAAGDGMNVTVEGDATGGTSEVLERSATDGGLGIRFACGGRWNADDGILAKKDELDCDKVWIFKASIEHTAQPCVRVEDQSELTYPAL